MAPNTLDATLVGDSGIAASAAKRNFARNLLGEFSYYRVRSNNRVKAFLPRNMTRVLAFHEKQRMKGRNGVAGSGGGTVERRSSTRNSAINGNASTIAREPPSHVETAQPTGANGIPTTNGNSDHLYDHDTSIPADKAMSKMALLSSKKDDTYGSGHRRSLRRQLEKQHEDDNAHLVIDLCNMRKKLNFKENKPNGTGPPPRKRLRRDAIKSHCHLCIWDNSLGMEQSDPIIRKSEACEVISSADSASPEVGKFVEVKLASPFVIRSKDLKIWKNINGQSQRVFSAQYFMEIKIIPNNPEVEWPPIPLLGKSEGDQTTKLGDMAADRLQASLVARYQHLPQAPDSETPLSVFYLDEGRTYRTKYGMEVSSTWTKADPSTLNIDDESADEEIDDWALDEEKRPFGRIAEPKQNPTPKKKPDTRSQPPKVTYYIDPTRAKGAPKKFRRCFLMGFRCPSCPGQKFKALDELQFHLLNCHHQYRFILDEELHDVVTGDLASVLFKVESVEMPRSRNIEKPKRQTESWEWTAPDESFDLQQFVNGDQSWIGVQNKRKQGAAIATVPARPDRTSELRKASGGFLRARDVLPFRPDDRRRHPVIRLKSLDKAQSIPYTSISHRQVGDDEGSRSETDDEMDNEWFVGKFLQNLDITAGKESWTSEQRLLRKKWDRHLFKERLPHSRYLSESFVRFVRAEKALLAEANPDMMLAFVTMLEEMKQKKIINTTVAEDIEAMLDDPNQRTYLPMRHILHPREDEMQPFTCGRCRKFIPDQGRKAVHCSDLHCETPSQWYHAHCAECKLDDKHLWKCPTCRSRKGKGKAF